MLIMGRIFQNGIGVPRNNDSAAVWYRKAAGTNSADGM